MRLSRTRPRPACRGALVLLGLLGIAPSPSGAQTWQVEYDPDLGTLPSAQGFTHFVSDPAPADGLSEGNYLVALGVLTQGNTGGPNQDNANQQAYRVALPPSRFEEDVLVVDLRLKILASTQSTTAAGFSFAVTEGHNQTVGVFIGATSVFLFTANGTAHSQFTFDTTAGFNDYRLRIDRWRAQLEINGDAVLSRDRDPDLWRSSGLASFASFGDASVVQRSSAQLELFRIARFNPPTADVHDHQIVTQTSALDSSGTKTVTVVCPTGLRPLGAGANVFDSSGENGIANVGLSESRPTGGPPATSWTVTARELVATATSWRLEVEALCGELSDYEIVTNATALSTDRAKAEHADCGEYRSVVGGGARVIGATLNQAITRGFVPPLSITPTPAWRIGMNDFGAGATSSAAWGIEVYAICTRAIDVERVEATTALDGLSSKQATVNCPTGKVPIHGAASLAPDFGIAGEYSAIRFSAPKYADPGEPPVGWLVESQSQMASWQVTASATCVPRADPTVSKSGLRGRWMGEFGAFDSWHARHGILENGVGFAPGVDGHAFELSAASQQWVRIPSTLISDEGPPWLYPERSFTVDAWIATDTLSPDLFTAIVNVYDFGGTDPMANCSSWQLTLTEDGFPIGAIRPAQQGCVSEILTGDTSLADGLLHHVAFTRDNDTRRASLYVDGRLEAQTTITLESTDGPLFPGSAADPIAIGIWRASNSTNLIRAFEGLIDDVKVYDRALSLDEIQNIAGCHLPILPRVLDLDAALFGNRPGGEHALCVFLEAGTYRLTLLSPSQSADARFTAWSPAPGLPWGTQFTVDPEIDNGFAFGLPVGASTMQAAFDATSDRDVDFTLTADQQVYFSLQDLGSLDNRGGVSVRLEAPEPGPGLLVVTGTGLLAFLGRKPDRRSRPPEPPHRRVSAW